jgi:hypothetical protein
MSKTWQVNALSIGHSAHNILSSETSAEICGHTSEGIFAITSSKKVFFITHQPYRGPLTINLKKGSSIPELIQPGSKLTLSKAGILCDHPPLEILLSHEIELWFPPKLDMKIFNLKAFTNHCGVLERELLKQISEEESSLISPLQWLDAIRSFPTIEKSLAYLHDLLGKGEGLTPSGDDFICGFLLAAQTWKDTLFPGIPLEESIQKIADLAWKKTTTLSANLIACAALGSADERIMDCVKWLHQGAVSAAETMKELRKYGSSSGIDTLAGMLACIHSSPLF